jgi:hypothetical protein
MGKNIQIQLSKIINGLLGNYLDIWLDFFEVLLASQQENNLDTTQKSVI